MKNLKPLHRKKLIKKLKKLWFEWPFSWWKHQYMMSGNFRLTIPNIHSWKDIPVPIIKAILKQSWVSKDKFLNI